MFEQHCALLVQSSDWTRQIAPPQTPLLQLRSQQSSAFSQVAPFPRQKFVHRVTPLMPCTGSQRPLQHSFIGPATQSAFGARHESVGRQTFESQRPVQHSPPVAQVAPMPAHATGVQVPDSQAPEQQLAASVHASPVAVHEPTAPQVPPLQSFEQQSVDVVQAAPSAPSEHSVPAF